MAEKAGGGEGRNKGGGRDFSLSPSPQQSNASAVLSRHWHTLPGCPQTLHQGLEKPEGEPGCGGKKCLLQLLRRPRGPVRKSGRRGLPGNHCLGPCFLQAFVTKDVLFQTPTPHLRSSSIFMKRRVILSMPAGQVGCDGPGPAGMARTRGAARSEAPPTSPPSTPAPAPPSSLWLWSSALLPGENSPPSAPTLSPSSPHPCPMPACLLGARPCIESSLHELSHLTLRIAIGRWH